ncbi:MAG TPA: hypothetical protein ENF22_06225 [Chloroflexi bacterium]|nr:hypothetical protein [Chloroflexota bacterium]
MGRSKTLYQIQQYNTQIDDSSSRIRDINAILIDNDLLVKAQKIRTDAEAVLLEKKKVLTSAETIVGDHSLKIDQNQKKLYSGLVTNPKELEDLQLESESLNKYLSVLEERQLEAMLDMEEAQKVFDATSVELTSIQTNMDAEHANLLSEKEGLEIFISDINAQKESYLSSTEIPDFPTYEAIRKSSGGIAVTLMISNSCSSCGANIPSAIAQEARSPTKLAFCPTCKRILHPG